MNAAAFQIARICAVIALVCIAAALATPKGRLPLALRGLAKLLRSDAQAPVGAPPARPSAARRSLAFLLVLLAGLLALV